jgi:hypothetical protein
MKPYPTILFAGAMSLVTLASSHAQDPDVCRETPTAPRCETVERDLPPRPNKPVDRTYEDLRRAGLERVEPAGSEAWTDHNIHDPGMSVMDAVCYGLSDLACRAARLQLDEDGEAERGDVDERNRKDEEPHR